MTQADAEVAVRKFLANSLSDTIIGDAVFYRINGELDTNDVIASIKGPVDFATNAVGDSPQWGFFLDKAPKANWEHPAAYILVLLSGAVVMHDDTAPPTSSLANRLQVLPALSSSPAATSQPS